MTAPTWAEVNVARYWLARRGVQVAYPTAFLAIRIGESETARLRMRRLGGAALAVAGAGVLLYVALLLGGLGYIPALAVLVSASTLRQVWHIVATNKEVANRLSQPSGRPGGIAGLGAWSLAWYCAAAVITFGGGITLTVVMALKGDPKAWQLVSALLIAALVSGTLVVSILRRPVIAEDDASHFVDSALRARDLQDASPAVWSLLVPSGFMAEDALPREFLPAAIAYSAIAIGVQLIAWIAYRRRFRRLPPGNYGSAWPEQSKAPPQRP